MRVFVMTATILTLVLLLHEGVLVRSQGSNEFQKLNCSSGCLNENVRDGICQLECLTPQCNYDGADCCEANSQCVKLFLGDGTCDNNCNNNFCGFDEGDCTNRPPQLFGQPGTIGVCLQAAQSSTCDVSSSIRNGVCNPECNFSQCQFDGGDCDTSADSTSSFRLGSTQLGIILAFVFLLFSAFCTCTGLVIYNRRKDRENILPRATVFRAGSKGDLSPDGKVFIVPGEVVNDDVPENQDNQPDIVNSPSPDAASTTRGNLQLQSL